MSNMKKLSTLLFALLVTGCGCEQIETGHVGVVKVFGALQPGTLGEGFHWVNVFATVVEVSTQTGASAAEAIGASKDLQTVHTKVTLQWSTPTDGVPCLVQKFGMEPGSWTLGIVEPAVQEVVKAVSAKYTAEELVTKRADVHKGVEEGVNEFVGKTLKDRGCQNAIRIANVAITNFEFSHEFNASIEAKVKAEQDALRAENEKRKMITEAEAKAQQLKLSADANAYQTEVESKQRAAAIERESKALQSNPQIVQLRIAERWNGVLPTYTGNSIPLLQMTAK